MDMVAIKWHLINNFTTLLCSYVGDEHGSFSVIKFEAEEGQLLKSSNNLSATFLRGNFVLFIVLMIDIF